jgi:hypothetical protein
MKKTPSLKKIIQKVTKELDWPLLEREHDIPAIRITSNPKDRSHILLLPTGESISSQLDHLHELGHALFCERVHPIFAENAYITSDTDKRKFSQALPAINAALDWFICHWMTEVAPDESKAQIAESLPIAEKALQSPAAPPPEPFMDVVLTIALAINYLDEPIDCGGVLKIAVDAFLAVPPGKPSSDACVALANSLLATYTDLRVTLVKDEDFSVWKVIEPAEASAADAGTP